MLTIVFMGTPDFAVPALQALHDHHHHVCLVVTQPDRPKGRGRRLIASPVKTKAVDLGFPVLQPLAIKCDDVYHQLSALKPDLFVVAAFGHVLNKRLLDLPRLGAINIHASLLPRYRGAAPIHRAIIEGETETGITTMMMDTGVDTGDILLCEKLSITPEDTAASLHDRLSELGASLLINTLEKLESGTLERTPQDHTRATYAPMLTKSAGQVDWGSPAPVLERFVRGMMPWPGAFTYLKGKRIKIFKTCVLAGDTHDPPGTVLKGFPDELRVATAHGILSILEIQGASGKRLDIKDFLRGSPIAPGVQFG